MIVILDLLVYMCRIYCVPEILLKKFRELERREFKQQLITTRTTALKIIEMCLRISVLNENMD